jgi:ABC-type glycerol-3-phosphate transport system substrate-binding protein
MVSAFNRQNPSIYVNSLYSGSYSETFDKVIARIDAGIPPTVVVLDVNKMVEMVARDAIIPLNDYIMASGGSSFLDQFYATMFSSERYDFGNGNVSLMGFPMMRSTPVLYYNKDMLDAANVTPPTSWEELLVASSKLTSADTVKGLAIPDTWR